MNDVAVSLQSNEPTMTDKAVRNVVSLPDVSEGNPAFLAMRKVLEMIAAPSDCGCSPICRCGELSSIEAERDWMRDTAKECLSLLTSSPSCIGFSLPMDWDDKILAEMVRRFELRGDHDDRMRNDDTQIGVEFAIEHIKSQMLEASQRETFAGCGMKVSSIWDEARPIAGTPAEAYTERLLADTERVIEPSCNMSELVEWQRNTGDFGWQRVNVEDLPHYREKGAELRALYAAQRLAARPIAENRRFRIEWVAGARPPVHPNPMTGRHSFPTFDDAVAFMSRQAPDAQFVSLTEYQEQEFDVSNEARAVLSALKGGVE